jgi:hypothetical protein
MNLAPEGTRNSKLAPLVKNFLRSLLEFLLDNSSIRRLLILFGVVLALYACYFVVVFLSNRAVLRLRGRGKDAQRFYDVDDRRNHQFVNFLNRPLLMIGILTVTAAGLFGLLLWMTHASC